MARLSAFFVAVLFFTGTPVLAEQSHADQVFGQSLMSAEEVQAHKTRLADCRSDQERKQVEAAHKDRMVQRARWKGLVLRGETQTVSLSLEN